jgi:hypothetical protein
VAVHLQEKGKGSFFKPHKDTPRGEHAFATLVVALPTPHKGGALVLRYRGKEWRFDSSKILHDQWCQGLTSVAYIAFYGDVEHEVEVVESGHRITLTYNISFATGKEGTGAKRLSTINPGENAFEETLAQLLMDPSFLPGGGNLGFGLRHQYPISYDRDAHIAAGEGRYDRLEDFVTERKVLPRLEQRLKGWDAIVKRICTNLGLDAHLRVIYKTEDALVMCESVFYKFEGEHGGEEWKEWGGGKVIETFPRRWNNGIKVQETVMWMTPMTTYTSLENSHTAYGNEPTLEYTYGNVCLVAKVGSAEDRIRGLKSTREKKRSDGVDSDH